MRIKKSGGKIFGASFTAAEKKAMDIEIGRQLAEKERALEKDLDCVLLYTMMVKYGWGPKRLYNLYKALTECHNDLVSFYEMPGEGIWLRRKKLEEAGVDFEKWADQIEKETGGVVD